jgi:CubicO group peptidase (beta-lactamase class C family)
MNTNQPARRAHDVVGHRGAPRGLIRIRGGFPLALATAVAIVGAAGRARASTLAVETLPGGDSIVVTCRGDLAWKAIVDRANGGVVRHFSIPADGPNLVADELKTDGSVNPFRGMFNTFYMTRIDKGENPQDRIKAKGTFWGKSNGTATVRVVSQAEDQVVVEARGRGFGWRLLGPADEEVVTYRQSYTFRPDRIVCDGELTWVYPHGTRLREMSLNTYFATDAVAYPLRLTTDDGRTHEVGLTSSTGTRLPEGFSYPLNFDVTLKNGHRLRFRPLMLPEAVRESRWFSFERPWQTSWDQSLAITGDTEKTSATFSADEPTRYRYEMQIARLAPEEVTPRLTITAPARESSHRLGETLKLTASVAEGRSAPTQPIEWAVYYPFSRLIREETGASITHVIPRDYQELKGEYLYAVATMPVGGGRTTQDVVKINVDPHVPPVGTESTFEWQAATPESQGLSAAALDAFWDDLKGRQTAALLVVRNDRLVFERYGEGWGPARKHYTASMAKALVGGMSTAAMLSDGRITLDDKVSASVSAWKADPRKASITLRQLGSHTSGLEDAEQGDIPHDKLTGWKGRFWKREAPPNDPFSLARDAAPVVFEPGTKLSYSNPGIAMLSYALTYVLTDLPQKDVRELLRERILRPIGVRDDEWSVGYGTTVHLHGLPLVAAWGGGGFTPRATARVARLLLREGDWDGTRVLTPEAVRQVTHDAGTPGNGGIGWWTNSGGEYKSLPADAYFGAGAGDQVVLVIPSLNLLAVRNGGALEPGPDVEEGLERRFFAPLMRSLGAAGRPRP